MRGTPKNALHFLGPAPAKNNLKFVDPMGLGGGWSGGRFSTIRNPNLEDRDDEAQSH